MKEWIQIKKILEDNGIKESDIEITKEFFLHFPFEKRQQLMGIFGGFPKEAGFFIELIKKKKVLAENHDITFEKEIIGMEETKMENIIKKIEE